MEDECLIACEDYPNCECGDDFDFPHSEEMLNPEDYDDWFVEEE